MAVFGNAKHFVVNSVCSISLCRYLWRMRSDKNEELDPQFADGTGDGSNFESGPTWSESNGSDAKIMVNSDTTQDAVEAGERRIRSNSDEREIMWNDEPDIRRIPRTGSLDNFRSADENNSHDKSYLYSFRMPHVPNDTKSDGASVDYNFVLDNYIEYADDTKIPRLRGKATNNVLLAAIHDSHWAVLVAVVTASCFLTYSLSNHAPFLRADLSQAIVITAVLATFPEVAASSGAGAFAGMAGIVVMPNYGWLALLSLIVSATWMVFYHFKILVGCGGRLGTCAFIAMNVTAAIFLMPSGTVPWSFYGDASQLWSERLELVPSILTVVASTFLSAAGGAVRLKSEIPLNPVQAPTTIALICMMILEPTDYIYTDQIDAGFAVGSFVAMASDQYLPTIFDFAAAGFTAGLWILLLDPFFLEFGGKKGFTSFCGFATYLAIRKIIFRGTADKDKK